MGIKRYIEIKKLTDSVIPEYRVVFKVGVQSFYVNDSCTKEEAEWMANMFEKALNNVMDKIIVCRDHWKKSYEELKGRLGNDKQTKDQSPY